MDALYAAPGNPGMAQECEVRSAAMTDPEAVIASRPTVTGATNIVFDPIKTRGPISVRCLFTPS